VGGRVSQRTNTAGLLLASVGTWAISQSSGWNDFGAPSSVRYPDDTDLSTDPARTVCFT